MLQNDVGSDGRILSHDEMQAQIKEIGSYGLAMKFIRGAQHQVVDKQDSKTETSGIQLPNGRLVGELPINQATLLGTLFLFCHVCLEGTVH